MKCVIKRPFADAHKSIIANDNETLESIIGGYIEVLPFPLSTDVWMLCNEDGHHLNLDENVMISEYGTPILGTIIVASANDDGDFTDLSEYDCASIVKFLNDHDSVKLAKERTQK